MKNFRLSVGKQIVALIALTVIFAVIVYATPTYKLGPRTKTVWGAGGTYTQRAYAIRKTGDLAVPPTTIAAYGVVMLRLTNVDLVDPIHSIQILGGDSLSQMVVDLSSAGPSTIIKNWPSAIQTTCRNALAAGASCELTIDTPYLPLNLIQVKAYSLTSTQEVTMEYGLTF